MRNIRILIVGGGVAGLTLACLLKQQKIDALILEKKDIHSQESGYYVAIWPSGSNVLKGLDLYERYSRISTPLDHYKIRNEQGDILYHLDLQKEFSDSHEETRILPRGSLIKLLNEQIEEKNLIRGARLKSFKQKKDGTVLVSYNDKEEVFDLVVGADGINSQTRKLLCGNVALRDTEWRGLAWYIDNPTEEQHTISEYWCKGKMIGFYPYRTKYFCFAGLPNSLFDRDLAKMHCISFLSNNFRHISEELNGFLDQTREHTEFYQWPLKDVVLNRWVYHDNSVLIGDAANAILPTAGAGVACAMESAAVLADEISRVDRRNLASGLRKYELRHSNRVKSVQKISEQIANWVCTESSFKVFERNLLLRGFGDRLFMKQLTELINEPF